MPELSIEDEEELAEHLFSSEASRVMAAVLARCIRYTERCDEQMTARMQRKNRQVGVHIPHGQSTLSSVLIRCRSVVRLFDVSIQIPFCLSLSPFLSWVWFVGAFLIIHGKQAGSSLISFHVYCGRFRSYPDTTKKLVLHRWTYVPFEIQLPTPGNAELKASIQQCNTNKKSRVSSISCRYDNITLRFNSFCFVSPFYGSPLSIVTKLFDPVFHLSFSLSKTCPYVSTVWAQFDSLHPSCSCSTVSEGAESARRSLDPDVICLPVTFDGSSERGVRRESAPPDTSPS